MTAVIMMAKRMLRDIGVGEGLVVTAVALENESGAGSVVVLAIALDVGEVDVEEVVECEVLVGHAIDLWEDAIGKGWVRRTCGARLERADLQLDPFCRTCAIGAAEATIASIVGMLRKGSEGIIKIDGEKGIS